MAPKQINERLLSWASIVDPKTLEQAKRTASMPFVFPHLALMPDAHLGKGATVGSVIPTLAAIIPAAVGVDIGCGMIAVKVNTRVEETAGLDRRRLRERIERVIPLSAGNYNRQVIAGARKRVDELSAMDGVESAKTLAPNWPLQLGTLGSGNHFIEVCVDEEGWLWLFLHSGSRGVGNKVALHHIKVAAELCKRQSIDLPDPDLAYLVEDTDEFDRYITDLRWAQHFAFLNREEMMDRVLACFAEWIGTEPIELDRINCHHNYTQKERHYGRDVWVSRKGAIEAREGTPGLIPGSMGTASYVVEGKGNALALHSSPHGAGRSFSRSAAKKRFTRNDLDAAMEGIEWRHSDAFLDEIPGAYKPIDVVMADAADLVSVRHTLRQIVNVKGD